MRRVGVLLFAVLFSLSLPAIAGARAGSGSSHFSSSSHSSSSRSSSRPSSSGSSSSRRSSPSMTPAQRAQQRVQDARRAAAQRQAQARNRAFNRRHPHFQRGRQYRVASPLYPGVFYFHREDGRCDATEYRNGDWDCRNYQMRNGHVQKKSHFPWVPILGGIVILALIGGLIAFLIIRRRKV